MIVVREKFFFIILANRRFENPADNVFPKAYGRGLRGYVSPRGLPSSCKLKTKVLPYSPNNRENFMLNRINYGYWYFYFTGLSQVGVLCRI